MKRRRLSVSLRWSSVRRTEDKEDAGEGHEKTHDPEVSVAPSWHSPRQSPNVRSNEIQ